MFDWDILLFCSPGSLQAAVRTQDMGASGQERALGSAGVG